MVCISLLHFFANQAIFAEMILVVVIFITHVVEQHMLLTRSDVQLRLDTHVTRTVIEYELTLAPEQQSRRELTAGGCLCIRIIVHTALDRFFLEDKETPPNIRDDRGDTPLNIAAYSGQRAAVEELLRHGADINAKNNKVWGVPCARLEALRNSL